MCIGLVEWEGGSVVGLSIFFSLRTVPRRRGRALSPETGRSEVIGNHSAALRGM